jgi:hypothetical protein
MQEKPLSIKFAIGLTILNLLFLLSVLGVLFMVLRQEPAAGTQMAQIKESLVETFQLDLAEDPGYNIQFALGKLLLPLILAIVEIFLLLRGRSYIFLWVVLVLHMTMTFPLFGFPLAEILTAALLIATPSRAYFNFDASGGQRTLD